MERIFEAIDGKFGKYTLKPKYRRIWRVFTYGGLVVFVYYLMLKFFNVWDVVVDFLNHVIWG